MRIARGLLIAILALPALAQVREELDSYLVAPYTMNRKVALTTRDFTKLEGKVVGGDEDKVIVEQKGGRVEVPVGQIYLVQLRRPRRSAKVDFIGNLIGGVGLGLAGAAIGREAAESIRGEGDPGRAGPVVGGIVLGFAGGYLGKEIARRLASQEVTLLVMHQAPAAPKSGSLAAPIMPIQPLAPLGPR